MVFQERTQNTVEEELRPDNGCSTLLNFLSLLSAGIYLVVCGIFVSSGIPVFALLLHWVLWCAVLFYFGRKIFSVQSFRCAKTAWFFISAAGSLQTLMYFYAYRELFAPFFDDSFYYNQMIAIAKYGFIRIRTFDLFPALLSVLYRFFSCFCSGSELHILTFLPFNWFCGACVLGFAMDLFQDYKKSETENEEKAHFSCFAFFLLLFNPIFIDTFSNLYRDTLLLLFVVLNLKCCLEGKFIKAFLLIVPCMFLRNANAMLMLMLTGALFLIEKFKVKKLNRCLVFTALFLTICFVIPLGNSIGLGKLRNISASGLEEQNFSERMARRYEKFEKGKVYSVIGWTMTVFSPIKFRPFTSDLDYRTESASPEMPYPVQLPVWNRIFRVDFFFVLAALIMWCFAIPKIVLGMWFASDRNAKLQTICLYCLFSAAVICMVSMQARHKPFYMLLFPFFIMLFDSAGDKKPGGLFRMLCCICAVIIFFVNFLLFI